MISGKKCVENLTDNFKNIGYNFNHFEEMNIITISEKMDMSYDFYIEHNMHVIEWRINAMITKNRKLIKK